MLLIERMSTNDPIHTCNLKPQTTNKDNFTMSNLQRQIAECRL